MPQPVFLRLAARNLVRNRRRSLISLGAIAIGLAGLLFLWGYIGGINLQMVANVTGYLTAHLQVHRSGYHDNPELDLAFTAPQGAALARLGVIASAPRIEGEALASGADKTRGVRVLGIDPAREVLVTTLSRAVRNGRYPDAGDADGVLLGAQLAATLDVGLGDSLTLVTQAADGSIGAARYHVRGLFDSGIDFLDSNYLLMPLAAAQSLFALEGRITTLALRLGDIDTVPATAAALQRRLGREHEVLGWEQLLPALADDVKFHEYMTHIILAVVFVVVTLGIANTILMGLMERVREFGILLALGTAAPQLARTVIYEALLLGLGGGLAGSLLGLGIVAWFGERGIDLARYAGAVQMMPGLTGVVYPRLGGPDLLFLNAAILLMTLVASLYPAWKAARLAPVQAIQGVPPAGGRWQRPLRHALPLPPRALFLRVALRNLARNPRRAVLTVGALGAGLAAYLFLSALGQGFFLQMRDNATGLLSGQAQIERPGFRDEFDARLTLPEPDLLLARVRADPAIAAAAPRLQAMAMLGSPRRSEAVMLYGVDPATEPSVTRLHRQLREGRYLASPAAREIVIGHKLAERLGVRLGEKIVIMAPAADGSLGSEALRIRGISETGNDILDRSVALIPLAAARELLGVGEGVATIVLRFRDIDHADADTARLAPGLAARGAAIVSWRRLLPEVVQMLDLLQVNLRVILLVVFTIVALGVTNTLLMAVLERTREFGLQLALGTRPAQIVRMVLYESLLLALLGLLAGFATGGAIVAYYHAAGFDLTAYAAATRAIPGMTGIVQPTLVPRETLVPLVTLLLTGLLAALYPAWRAARLDAAQALRHG